MISDKYETIFVHIPKCGGTSIESIIWGPTEKIEANLWMGFVDKYHNKFQTGGLQHLKAFQIRQHIGREKFNKYFKFAMVRNPFAKLVSQYLYMRSRADLRDFIGMNIDDSFLDYLLKIQNRAHVQWERQVAFLYDYTGKCLVDLVVKMEEIGSVPERLKDRGKLPVLDAIPKVNSHPGQYDFRSFLCERSTALITDLFREDFEMLHYSKVPS